MILLDSSVGNKYDGNDGGRDGGGEMGEDGNEGGDEMGGGVSWIILIPEMGVGDEKIILGRLVWFNGDKKKINKRIRERVGSSAVTM